MRLAETQSAERRVRNPVSVSPPLADAAGRRGAAFVARDDRGRLPLVARGDDHRCGQTKNPGRKARG
jgi:hypothetical protein